MDTKTDRLIIDQLCFYEGVTQSNFKNEYSTTHLTCVPEITIDPAYCYTPTRSATLTTDQTLALSVASGKLTEGKPTETELKNTYVFTLVNSGNRDAGTYGLVTMDITYTTTKGQQVTLDGLSLKDLVVDFCGSGARTSGTDESQYYIHMSGAGSTTQFALEIASVDHFDSIKFSLSKSGHAEEFDSSGDTSGMDSWQIASITIAKAEKIGQRHASSRVDGVPKWERSVTSTKVAWSNQRMLLQAGITSQTLNLSYIDSAGNTVKPDVTVTVENTYLTELPTSMTYQEASKDLGLIVPKSTYQISVDVADVSDAGSTNYFYFQLIFENGTSAVVLANQQLSSDSFRQGQIETFQIQTTQNYGVLKSVRIICDSATSTSNVFDKLNISKISVLLTGTTGVSRVWEIENVGWIDINYSDEGASYYDGNNDVITSAETTNVQLVKEYAVTGITTAVDLQFCISTASSNLSSDDKKDISAVLTYLDSSGIQKTENFDLTRKIQAYNSTDNTKRLYRGNYIDRFVISVADISSVLSLEISRGDGSGNWKIRGVSVQQVADMDNLYLSYSDEYIRSYNTVTDLAVSENSQPESLDANESALFTFSENTIAVSESADDSWTTQITREPITSDDTLNIYLYSGALTDTQYPFTANSSIQATVKYTTTFGTYMQNSAVLRLGTSNGQNILYAQGLTATSMTTLNQLVLTNLAGENIASYAIVEQVRGGIIVATYQVNFSGSILSNLNGVGTPEILKDKSTTQTLTLQSAPSQDPVTLTESTYDVAVALRYTTSTAPDGRKTVYQTPYVFLTDQQITTLASNQNVELDFEAENVDSVVGLAVVTSGPTFKFERAMIRNYDKNGNLLSSDGITETFAASTISSTVNCDSENMVPVTITVLTAPNSSVSGAGTFGEVSLDVTYTEPDEDVVTVSFPDVPSRLSGSSSLEAGGRMEFTVLLSDVDTLDFLTLYAPDDDWYVQDVAVTRPLADGSEEMKAVTVNNWATRTAPLVVDLNGEDNVIVSMNLSVRLNSSSSNLFAGSGESIYTTVKNGDVITLTPSFAYTGTPDTTVTWNLGNAESFSQAQEDGSMKLTIPEDAAPETVCTVLVHSNANPSLQITATFYVLESNVIENPISVECVAQESGNSAIGTSHNDVNIQANLYDTLILTPLYDGDMTTASDWTWETNGVKGGFETDIYGQLFWDITGEYEAGSTVFVKLVHKTTAIPIYITVTVTGDAQVESISATATASSSTDSFQSGTDSILKINATTDDVVVITPFADGAQADGWTWNLPQNNFLESEGAYGVLTIKTNSMVSIGDVYTLILTHGDSGKTITVLMTIVGEVVDADTVVLEAVVDSTDEVFTATGGGTLKLETTNTEKITLTPKLNGELLTDNEWVWDISEVRYFIAANANGQHVMDLMGKPTVGVTYHTSVTHRASGTVINVELTIVPKDIGESTISTSAFHKHWLGEDVVEDTYTINPGETLKLKMTTLDDVLYITPLIDDEMGTKDDWVWFRDGKQIPSVDSYMLKTANCTVGDTITFVITHQDTDQTMTIEIEIVEQLDTE